jgi:hypothetical protein
VPYTIVFLTRGKNFVTDETEAAKLRQRHFEDVFQLRAEGIVIMMLGTREDGDLRTIEVCATADVAEVERPVKQDSGVAAGHFGDAIHQAVGIKGDTLK